MGFYQLTAPGWRVRATNPPRYPSRIGKSPKGWQPTTEVVPTMYQRCDR
jgi:hypothetical protein